MHGKVCHMKMYHIIPSNTDQFSHRCSDNCHVQRWPKQPQSTAGWPKEPLISKMAQRATFNSWKCECEDIDIFLIPNRCVFVCLLYWWLIGSFCADSRSFACILFFWIFRGSWGHIDGSFFRSRLRRERPPFGKTAMVFFVFFKKMWFFETTLLESILCPSNMWNACFKVFMNFDFCRQIFQQAIFSSNFFPFKILQQKKIH